MAGSKLRMLSQVFTSMALFNILISPLNAFPWVINGLMEAWVSTKRIQAFLKLGELDWDKYYSDMYDVTATNGDDDRASNTSSPRSESRLSEEKTKGDLHVVEINADSADGTLRESSDGRAPVTTVVSKSDNLSIAKREIHNEEEEELYVGSPPASTGVAAVGGGGGAAVVRFLPTPDAGRRSGRSSRQRRKTRVIAVKDGVFTWTRKDGERGGGDKGGSKDEEKEKENVNDTKTPEDVAATDSISPVEWILSDLSFSIYSVSTCMCI